MAEPLRHRQTKEADNRYVRPTATAPHLDSTKRRRTQSEDKESAYAPTADIQADIDLRRFGMILLQNYFRAPGRAILIQGCAKARNIGFEMAASRIR
jgi:hypothetical protein